MIEQIVKCGKLGISIAFRPNTKTNITEIILYDMIIGTFEKAKVTHELIENSAQVTGIVIEDCIKRIMEKRYADGTGSVKELG